MYRMTDTFLDLVYLIGPHVIRQDMDISECVSVEEGVLISLKYMINISNVSR